MDRMTPTLAATLAAAMMIATPAAADPLAAYRGSQRIVVASAPSADSPALLRQRALFKGMGAGARARDLVLLEAVGSGGDARALRQAAGLGGDGFAAALIGKDGGVKLRSTHPLDAAQLSGVIDAMPMRQQERRERGE